MSEYKNVEEKVIFEKLTDMPLYTKNAVPFSRDECYAQNEGDRINGYLNEIKNRLQVLEGQKETSYYRVIVSDRKVIGKLVIFTKRVIRRLLKWLIEPICAQQTAFNNEVSSCISRLIEIEKDTRDQLSTIRDQMKKQAVTITDMEQNCSILQNKISLLDTSGDDKRSASQAGEDMILAYIAQELKIPAEECRYLDLGANHAKELSNTYYFYNKGARGVLVEANPHLINELQVHRNGDVILNKCISAVSGEQIEFYILSGDGLSTPDYSNAKDVIRKNPNISIVDTVRVETISVNDVLEQYFSEAPVILNIDIEGKELEILQSIDFEKHRPLIVILEMIPYQPSLVVEDKMADVALFMTEHGYIEYAFTGINSIFIDRDKIE